MAQPLVGSHVFVQCLLLSRGEDIADLKEVQQRRMKTVTAKGNLLHTDKVGGRSLQETGPNTMVITILLF